uniref:Uncharacterized protein n=1 Tax=Parascaris equorum TaxID=6256 RepID=A0A914S5E9_PAREQ
MPKNASFISKSRLVAVRIYYGTNFIDCFAEIGFFVYQIRLPIIILGYHVIMHQRN